MRTRRRAKLSVSRRVILLALLGTSACITVNIYFPAPEVRRAAEQIVEETWGEPGAAMTPGTVPDTPTDRSAGAVQRPGMLAFARVAAAHAQEIDIEVSTAAIRALKDAMRERAEQLKPQLRAGRLGIGRDGMLVVRDVGDLPLREQAQVRRLLEAENRDRGALYREIARANDFGEDRLDDIEKIFAETWIDKAESGWWVETAGGWKRAP